MRIGFAPVFPWRVCRLRSKKSRECRKHLLSQLRCNVWTRFVSFPDLKMTGIVEIRFQKHWPSLDNGMSTRKLCRIRSARCCAFFCLWLDYSCHSDAQCSNTIILCVPKLCQISQAGHHLGMAHLICVKSGSLESFHDMSKENIMKSIGSLDFYPLS